MFGELGVLGIIFAIVPGYIADLAFRACFGVAKGDEFDRSLRAIVWSVLGLVLFVAIWGNPPNFISVVLPGEPRPAFDRYLLFAFAMDTALCIVAAMVTGVISASETVQSRFTRVFRFSLTGQSPWERLWGSHVKERDVRVVLKNDVVYVGKVWSASTGTDDKELVLFDPSVEKEGSLTRLLSTRLVYLRGDEIREIQLSVNEKELTNVQKFEGLGQRAASKLKPESVEYRERIAEQEQSGRER